MGTERAGAAYGGGMKRLVAVVFVMSAGCGMRAQLVSAGEDTYRLKVESRLIETSVTVRDGHGALVTSLPQQAFHVREDGAEQSVRYFAARRDLPLSVGLIVDVSESQEKFVKAHEKAIEAFLKEVLEPRDRAFAVCFGNHLRLASNWTGSAEQLMDGVRKFDGGDREFAEVGPKETRALGTALYDAVYFSLDEKMSGEKDRRKVLIVLSDGEENSSEHDLIDAITAAQGANVLIYALRTTDNKDDRMEARDRYGMRVLDHMTEATGGETFDVRKMDVKDIFASIAADLRSIYEIGYYSTNPASDKSFRKVTVRVDGEGMTVRARAGYVPR